MIVLLVVCPLSDDCTAIRVLAKVFNDCSLNFTDISGMTKTTLLSNRSHIGLSWRLAVTDSYEILQWMTLAVQRVLSDW
jgi:hypothetical protein